MSAGMRACVQHSRRFIGNVAAPRNARFCTVAIKEAPQLSVKPSSAPGASETSPHLSGGAAVEPATGASGLPSLAPERSAVRGVTFRGPMAEDIEGGARYATAVSNMWSNIPNHVRASFTSPMNTDDAPKPAAPLAMDGLIAQFKSAVAQTGWAPAHWSASAHVYYQGRIPLAPYKKGQTAAYNYPKILVPRELAYRFPLDMYVDPVFQTSDPDQRLRMKGTTLFPRLQGKTTLVLIFSGQPLSGLWTGLRQWMNSAGQDFLKFSNTQYFRIHCEESWWSRRTHLLTKFHLRRQVEENELFTTFVYSGKWKPEYARALHLYNRDLPVVLLLDKLGYVRWHAVGLPSEDATETFKLLSRRLASEKTNYS